MSDTPICESCYPWAPATECCGDEWETHPPALQCRATNLAWSTLRVLTGGRVGTCPVTIRPCLTDRRCDACTANVGFSTPWWPALVGGEWINCGCGCAGCTCEPLHVIELPGRVARIESIVIDGNLVPEQAYRVDNYREVVRTDGASWPSCQDMNLPAGAPGSFTITYTPGIDPGHDGVWAAGLLACEYAKACTGAKCALPFKVTSVVRNGVSMEIGGGLFETGTTGIAEVDAYVASVNPNQLRTPSRVWSPDLPGGAHRFTS